MRLKTLTLATFAAITVLAAPALADNISTQMSLEQACGAAASVSGYVERCNPDLDVDGVVDHSDLDIMKRAFYGSDPRSDLNGDGVVNFSDLALMKAFFGYQGGGWQNGWQPQIRFDNSRADCPFIEWIPASSDVAVGESFTLTMHMDFSCEPTIGGGIDVTWNPNLLQLDSWDQIPTGDPGFGRDGDVDTAAGTIDGYGIGDFNGISGPADIATITFTALTEAATQVSASEDTNGITGPFVSIITFSAYDPPPEFRPADITIGSDNIRGTLRDVVLRAAWCVEPGNPPGVPVTDLAPPGYDCTAAGFSPMPANRIITSGMGMAQCGPAGTTCTDVGIDVTGFSPIVARCRNFSTGQEVSIGPLAGATSIDCSANGFLADSGQAVSIQVGGLTP